MEPGSCAEPILGTGGWDDSVAVKRFEGHGERLVHGYGRLPKSLVVLGCGAVGCELGQVLARFGVDGTTVEAQERLLPSGQAEVSEVVEAAFRTFTYALYRRLAI